MSTWSLWSNIELEGKHGIFRSISAALAECTWGIQSISEGFQVGETLELLDWTPYDWNLNFLRSESSLFVEGTELGGLRILFDLYALRCIAWVSSMITGIASRIYEVPALSSLCQPNPAEGWKGPNHSKGFKFSRANTILRSLGAMKAHILETCEHVRVISCVCVCFSSVIPLT